MGLSMHFHTAQRWDEFMNIEQRTILNVIARHVDGDVAALDLSAPLVDNGIDSLKFTAIMRDIERNLQRPIFNRKAIKQLRTVSDMLSLASVGMLGVA
jgi:acyl carrier protein